MVIGYPVVATVSRPKILLDDTYLGRYHTGMRTQEEVLESFFKLMLLEGYSLSDIIEKLINALNSEEYKTKVGDVGPYSNFYFILEQLEQARGFAADM